MDSCPKCKSSWKGELIPKKDRKHYSGTHFMRSIGIDGGYMGIYDGMVAIRCPDCHADFPRDKSQWGKEMFDKYLKAIS